MHLDTHLLVWMFTGETEKLSPAAHQALEDSTLRYSPMTALELQCLFEIGRLNYDDETILGELRSSAGLQLSEVSFSAVVDAARKLSFTRAPFDRLIVATAIVDGADLLTADRHLLTQVECARW